ncbi:MAG: hypothetical protein KC621_05240, partial [Myxococcales bacterium]|nr:hypothetical protein [Myxococcales bacterium]
LRRFVASSVAVGLYALALEPLPAVAGCTCQIEPLVSPFTSHGYGPGKGAALIEASSTLSNSAPVHYRIVTTGSGCENVVVRPYGHISHVENDSDQPYPGLRAHWNEIATCLPPTSPYAWGEIVSASPGWAIHSLRFWEDDYVSSFNDTAGLQHAQIVAVPQYDCSFQGQTGCATEQNYERKIESDICIAPDGEIPVFSSWKPTAEFLARFRGRLTPESGANRAEWAVDTSHPQSDEYLHEVREVDPGGTYDNCQEVVEATEAAYAAAGRKSPGYLAYVDDNCPDAYAVTGGRWLMQPADVAVGQNIWGWNPPSAPTFPWGQVNGYTPFDSIGWDSDDCLDAYAIALEDPMAPANKCAIVIPQQMEYQCRLGSDDWIEDPDRPGRMMMERPAGEWWYPYQQHSITIDVFTGPRKVRVRRGSAVSTWKTY